jgi:hypothetical protein
MAGVYEPGDEWSKTEEPIAGGGACEPDHGASTDADGDTDTAELVAQIRELAAHDPAGVQQVVREVLAALDRATRGAFRDQLADGTPFGGGFGEPPARVTDLEAAANRTVSGRSEAEPAIDRAVSAEGREQRSTDTG